MSPFEEQDRILIFQYSKLWLLKLTINNLSKDKLLEFFVQEISEQLCRPMFKAALTKNSV